MTVNIGLAIQGSWTVFENRLGDARRSPRRWSSEGKAACRGTEPGIAERSFVRALLLGWLALGLAVFSALPALANTESYAPPRIRITDGTVEPMPIAVIDFLEPGGGQYGPAISNVVRSNLERSGLFAPIGPEAYIQNIQAFNERPRFGDWRLINAQVLVTGQVTYTRDGRINVQFLLWDVFAERDILGLVFKVTPDAWRRVAHLISDQIYEALTGEKGYFDTRVVFISESGPKVERTKRLAIMDQDGANPMYLTSGQSMVLTPRFSPTRQQVVYMSYADIFPRVYLLDIESGEQEVVGDFPGMTFAPRFSPDGNQIIMSLERNGNSDIYVMDLRTRHTVRMTDHSAIDTSPSFSPDGQFVTFNSDRSGSPQIYVMGSQGTNVRRISFRDGSYATPVWSPRGDLIAFTKILSGRFYIGVMRPDGSGERLLTDSFLDEAPTWSPNGRVLMFFRQTPTRGDGSGGSVRLWSVDLTGHNLRQIPTVADASDPAWSPLLTAPR